MTRSAIYHPRNTNQKLPIILLSYDLIDQQAYEVNQHLTLDGFSCIVINVL